MWLTGGKASETGHQVACPYHPPAGLRRAGSGCPLAHAARTLIRPTQADLAARREAAASPLLDHRSDSTNKVSLSVPKERIAEPLLFGRTPRLDQGHAERGQSESRSGSPSRSAVARRAAPFPGGSTTSHVRSPARVVIRLPSACGSVSIAITFCVLMTTVSWASFALPSPIPLTLIGALDRVRFLHIFVTLTVARRSAAPGRRARAASARCNGRAILRGRAGKCTR